MALCRGGNSCVRPVNHDGACARHYQPWDRSGGENECAHGIAEGIPCERCDWPDRMFPSSMRIPLQPPPEVEVLRDANDTEWVRASALELAQQQRDGALSYQETLAAGFQEMMRERDAARRERDGARASAEALHREWERFADALGYVNHAEGTGHTEVAPHDVVLARVREWRNRAEAAQDRAGQE